MELYTSANEEVVVPEFLSGGGEMGQRIREFDWSQTPLGPIHTWPQSLRTCIRIMLTSRQPIWIGWGKELIKFYNDPYKAIAGGKHPWALGKPVSVVWKDVWRDIEPLLHTVMEEDEGTYVESQLLIMERNGYPEETYYTFSYTPIPGDDGGTAGMICANTDDTDRIISERQLRTLTQLGKNLYDPPSTAEVFERTIDTIRENPQDFPFALLYEMTDGVARLVRATVLASEIPKVPKVVPITGDTAIAASLAAAVALGTPVVMDRIVEQFGTMPSGPWATLPSRAIILPIILSGQNEAFGFLVIGLNPHRLLDEKYSGFFNLVADQVATSLLHVHAREEERKRVEALAAIDRAKTIFFSNISHEFRTPLTLLLGPIEDVLHDPQTLPDNRMRMEVAHRNLHRLQKLVNTLLEFSRIEAGREQGAFQRVDIGTYTGDLASIFRSAIEKAGMQLIVDAGAVSEEVYIDKEMWEKIVLNLVSNAFKYTKEGTIRIAIRQTGDGWVELSVADTGAGIPEEELEKIFDRFHRVENTRGRSQEGTGIGLAMVKELVRLHQGRIEVESRVGEGSVFRVTIPTGKDHLPSGKVIAPESDSDRRSLIADTFREEAMTWVAIEPDAAGLSPVTPSSLLARPAAAPGHLPQVLIADDNSDMRHYLERLLSRHFRVLTATNGEDAWRKILDHRPHLVLSDIMMPDLDGFGLLRRIRSYPDTRNIPLIFLSARAGEEARVEGLDAGADDYLVKPFSAKELVVRVGNHIRINEVRKETEQQFYELFQQAPAIIHVFRGPEHVVEVFHPAGKQWSGGKDLTGAKLREVWPDLWGQDIPEVLDEVYATGQAVIRNEHPVLLPDEKGLPEKLFFNIIFQPWRGLRGDIQGVISFATDVTEQVKARWQLRLLASTLEQQVQERTKELEQANESLRQSNEDLQQFAHVASHDLKEPLRKIKVFSLRLQDEFGDDVPEKGQGYLGKILHSIDRMNAMIEGVLTHSTFHASEETARPIGLAGIIDSIRIDLELLIQQKSARFEYSDLPVIEGFPILLYQLFYNLVYNSLKFSRPDVLPLIRISSFLSDERGEASVEIRVTDNGIGFDSVYEEKIFHTFTRLHSKDRYEGTGLGLSLCRKIVQRHGGSIIAKGVPGNGAEFIIILPVRRPLVS